MVIKVNKNTSKAEFEEKLKSIQILKKNINLNSFRNILPKGTDGLKYQKNIRNEWS